MSTATAEPAAGPAKAGGKKKLLLLVIPLLLSGAGAGLWFSGVLPPLLGMGKAGTPAEARGEPAHGAPPAAGHGAAPAAGAHGVAASPAATSHGGPAASGHDAKAATVPGGQPSQFFDLPEIIANLNSGARRTSFIKLHAKLELTSPDDQAAVAAVMPRLLDLFQTYLREVRPEELRGSAGTYRLREELIARAGLAVAPLRIVDVLFTEMLVQ